MFFRLVLILTLCSTFSWISCTVTETKNKSDGAAPSAFLKDLSEVPAAQRTDGVRLDPDRSMIYLPAGGKVDFYLRIPHQSSLEISRVRSHRGGSGPVELSVQRSGAIKARLKPIDIDSQAQRRKLPDQGGEITHLILSAPPADDPQAGVALIAPYLLGVALEEPKGEPEKSLTKADEASDDHRPNLIVYLVDTLRADHLGVYGYPLPTSPRLDAFARESVVFEDAVAQSPWTRASVASIFTGLEPDRHGVQDREDALPQSSRLLAEILSDAGYDTASVITNGNVGPEFGFDQGFHHFSRSRKMRHQADQLNDRVFPILNTLQEPFFLYVHSMDPHAPYDPPEPFRSRFHRPNHRDDDLGSLEVLKEYRQGKRTIDPASLEEIVSLYDASIAFNDEHFGQLLDRLREMDHYDDSLVIFVSDHGEEFWDHDDWGHGHTLYQELLRVPLVVKAPKQNEGRRVRGLAQHVDLFSTLLDYADIPFPEGISGQSLRSWLVESPPPVAPRSAYASLKLDRREGAAFIEGSWKAIIPRSRHLGNSILLYDRTADSTEQDNVASTNQLVRDYMVTWLRHHEMTGPEAQTPERAEMDEELVKELKALGYLQ